MNIFPLKYWNVYLSRLDIFIRYSNHAPNHSQNMLFANKQLFIIPEKNISSDVKMAKERMCA